MNIHVSIFCLTNLFWNRLWTRIYEYTSSIVDAIIIAPCNVALGLHMTSRRPYLCSQTKKWRPCNCDCLDLISWSRVWKPAIPSVFEVGVKQWRNHCGGRETRERRAGSGFATSVSLLVLRLNYVIVDMSNIAIIKLMTQCGQKIF